MTDLELRDLLADTMCRHVGIADWYEKADLVLADLREALNTERLADALLSEEPWTPESD